MTLSPASTYSWLALSAPSQCGASAVRQIFSGTGRNIIAWRSGKSSKAFASGKAPSPAAGIRIRRACSVPSRVHSPSTRRSTPSVVGKIPIIAPTMVCDAAAGSLAHRSSSTAREIGAVIEACLTPRKSSISLARAVPWSTDIAATSGVGSGWNVARDTDVKWPG